jgi:hypothetical protein
MRTIAEPLACLAILPVSIDTLRPDTSVSTVVYAILDHLLIFEISLFAYVQFLDKYSVALNVRAVQVVQKRTPLPDEFQKTIARMVVFRVYLDVTRKVVDALCKKRDLYVGVAGVTSALPVGLGELLLSFLC